ncbi:cytochrome b/b6 domain-containing protein [Comamonadaceae bacterium G21597-S1]|nr:cytochrome b/b6 domain-containing protein [Comamonadaceae bacterium G21597-S1]
MQDASNTIRVWDLPTRLFHWLLVACIIGSVVTSQIGGNAMIWHFRFGFSIATLLLFRLVWGVVGGRWSRFSSFLYAPGTVVRYFRGEGRPEHGVGHNPLGAASVFAMLVFLIAQVSSGVISDDEIAAVGPFALYVSNATVTLATSYHKTYGKFALIALIVLHLLAIAYYYFAKRNNLVKPMIDGDKSVASAGLRGSRDDAVSRLAAAVVLAACAGLVAWGVSLGN